MARVARLLALSLALLGALVGAGGAAPVGPIVTEVRLGAMDGRFVVEVVSSALLKYALVEGPGEPFTLTFYLLDATFAFPSAAREVQEGPLRQVVATMLEREESRLARLDLVFAQQVQYRIAQAGGRLAIQLGEPGVAARVVLRGSLSPSGDPLPPETPRAAPSPTTPKSFQPPTVTAPRPPPTPTATAQPGPTTPQAALPATGAASVPTSPGPPPEMRVPSGAPAAASPPVGPARPSVAPPIGLARPPITQPPLPTPPIVAAKPEPTAPPPPARPPRAVPAPLGAPPPPPPARTIRVLRLSRVAVSPETQVRVHADGPLPRYRAFTLPSPVRVVLDFDGATFGVSETTLVVGSSLVDRVRASRFRSTPTEVVRVVFDLKRQVPYWIEPLGDGVIVHVGSQGPTR